MTQTIHNETCNTADRISVDVYYHQNSAHPSNIENGSAKYRYTVSAIKFTQKDFASHVNCADLSSELWRDEIKLIADCFLGAAKNESDFVWKTISENGHNDYGTFFSSKEEAEADLYRQMC